MNNIIGYILVDINDDLVGTIEIKINGKSVTRKIDNFKIDGDDFGIYTERILEAVDTFKFLKDYYNSRGEAHNRACVVIREVI